MASRSRPPTSTAPRPARATGRRAEPRPSALNRYLLDSEHLVFAVRRHCAVLAGSTSLYLVVLVVAFLLLGFADGSGVIATTGLVVLLVGTAWFGWKVGDWWVERFTVTDRRVLLVSGLLTRRVAIMPLRKVTDLTFERSLLGRVLGYGAFVMESAGQQQALSRVDFLPRPESLYLQMSDLLFGSGGADHDPDEDGDHRGRVDRPPARVNRPGDRSGPPRAVRRRPPDPATSPPADPRPASADARVTSRPPVVPPPPGATVRRPAPAPAAPQPRVTSAGSPPASSATAPLPQIARDRPHARRPRGRLDPDESSRRN